MMIPISIPNLYSIILVFWDKDDCVNTIQANTSSATVPTLRILILKILVRCLPSVTGDIKMLPNPPEAPRYGSRV